MKVEGRVVSGKGNGRLFTELEWAKKKFVQILGFEIVPGTLNVLLKETTNQDILELKKDRTFIIEPPDNSFYRGILLPIDINSVVKGAIVVPQVPNYNVHLLEIVAPVNLRKKLGLKDGNAVTLDI